MRLLYNIVAKWHVGHGTTERVCGRSIRPGSRGTESPALSWANPSAVTLSNSRERDIFSCERFELFGAACVLSTCSPLRSKVSLFRVRSSGPQRQIIMREFEGKLWAQNRPFVESLVVAQDRRKSRLEKSGILELSDLFSLLPSFFDSQCHRAFLL